MVISLSKWHLLIDRAPLFLEISIGALSKGSTVFIIMTYVVLTLYCVFLLSIVVMLGCGMSGKGLEASLRFSSVRRLHYIMCLQYWTNAPTSYPNVFDLDVTLKHIDYQDVVPGVDTPAPEQSQTLAGAPITGYEHHQMLHYVFEIDTWYIDHFRILPARSSVATEERHEEKKNGAAHP